MLLQHLTRKISFLDPSSGKSPLKRVAARSAIVTIGIDPARRIFVLEAWAARCPTSDLIDRVFVTQERWKPDLFGCEANAMQSLFADTLVIEAKRRRVRLPLVPVYQPTKIDKDFRIKSTLQPPLADGRLFVREEQIELLSEIRSFPGGHTKDLVDALASAIGLLPPDIPAQAFVDEAQAVARQLRKAGAPPQYIEQKVREIHDAIIRHRTAQLTGFTP